VYCSGDSTPLILPRETRNRQQPPRRALPRDADPLRDLVGGGGETRLGLESRLQTELDANAAPSARNGRTQTPEGRQYRCRTSGCGSVVLVDEAAESIMAMDLAAL
jgi:hypothetical protein